MFMVRRIFWKIFFSVWLVNLGVLGLTALLVIFSLESTHLRERHQQFFEGMASVIVAEIEAQDGELNMRQMRNFVRKSPRFRQFSRHRAFRILDSNDTEIFNFNYRKLPPKARQVQFSFESDSGKSYRVESFIGPPPRFLLDALKRLNLYQFVMVLFASGLVAFVLGWHFSRPLKRLGAFSRRYGENENHETLDEDLLKRGDEIGDLARDMAFMSEQVKRNISNQKQLLHYVSHELRAPLARLQAIAGLVEQSVPQAQPNIEKIHKECDKISTLIQNILHYSRLDQVDVVRQEVNLQVLVQALAKEVEHDFPEQSISVEGSLLNPLMSLDEERIAHAVDNVLRNACKYSAGKKPVQVQLSETTKAIDITITDHGSGVGEDELDKIFTPFYRGGNAMHSDGYGLGLSIAKRVVEQHGGSISASNCTHGGLRVGIHLPREKI